MTVPKSQMTSFLQASLPIDYPQVERSVHKLAVRESARACPFLSRFIGAEPVATRLPWNPEASREPFGLRFQFLELHAAPHG